MRIWVGVVGKTIIEISGELFKISAREGVTTKREGLGHSKLE